MNLFCKKYCIAMLAICAAFATNAQNSSDLSLLYGSDPYSRLNVEYRKPINDKFKLKLGLTYGANNSGTYGIGGNRNVSAVGDSVIVFKDYFEDNVQSTFRIGIEDQIGTTIFSLGASILAGYRNTNKRYFLSTIEQGADGNWYNGQAEMQFTEFPDPSSARQTEHFLLTGARFSLNMDLPVKDRLFFHVGIATVFELPIYMGATNVIEGQGEFLGTPPSIFNFRMNGLIGFRYILGSGK